MTYDHAGDARKPLRTWPLLAIAVIVAALVLLTPVFFPELGLELSALRAPGARRTITSEAAVMIRATSSATSVTRPRSRLGTPTTTAVSSRVKEASQK